MTPFTEESMRKMYPIPSYAQDDSFPRVYDYDPIIEAMGEVVVRVDDSNYQGDTRLLLRRGDKYALTTFGWGSCSGCDALQACSSWDSLVSLANSLMPSDESWKSLPEMVEYVETHDWKGDYGYHADEQKDFIAKCRAALGMPAKALPDADED